MLSGLGFYLRNLFLLQVRKIVGFYVWVNDPSQNKFCVWLELCVKFYFLTIFIVGILRLLVENTFSPLSYSTEFKMGKNVLPKRCTGDFFLQAVNRTFGPLRPPSTCSLGLLVLSKLGPPQLS